MNQVIMADWLHAFYKHVNGRFVVLLMDNFPAHDKPLAGKLLAM